MKRLPEVLVCVVWLFRMSFVRCGQPWIHWKLSNIHHQIRHAHLAATSLRIVIHNGTNWLFKTRIQNNYSLCVCVCAVFHLSITSNSNLWSKCLIFPIRYRSVPCVWLLGCTFVRSMFIAYSIVHLNYSECMWMRSDK